MRRLTEGSDTTDVKTVVGIVVGVGGGILLITGVLWCLYRRYAGLGGSLAGIPPERKMLVFTDLGKMPDSTQKRISRPGSARPGSARRPQGPPTAASAAASAAAAAAAAAATQAPSAAAALAPQASPSPRATGRPTSGGRSAGSGLLPALSVGLEPEPLPMTPGSIASPRGHGRSLFSAMDPPRTSYAGGGPSASAATGPGGLVEDGSRPGSASGRPTTHLRASYTSGGGAALGTAVLEASAERPTSAGPRQSSAGPRLSSAGLRISSAGIAGGGAATPRYWATGAVTPSVGSGGSAGAGLSGGSALPPALVPTGSVTAAWRGPLGVPELEPERSLNSVAGAMTSLDPFDGGPAGPGAGPGGTTQEAAYGGSGVAADAAGTGPAGAGAVGGRPPLPGRSGPAAGPGGPGGGAGAQLPPRTSRSRPGSGGGPGGGGGTEPSGGGGGGSPASGPSWQRHSAVRTPRTSAGVGRRSSTGVADEFMSTVSGASSQFHSFSHAGDEAGGGGGGGTFHHRHHPHPECSLDLGAGSASTMLPLAPVAGITAAATAAPAPAAAATPARSRLRCTLQPPGLNTSVTSNQGSISTAAATPQAAAVAAAAGRGGGGGTGGWTRRGSFGDGVEVPAASVVSPGGSVSSAASLGVAAAVAAAAAAPPPSSPCGAGSGGGGAAPKPDTGLQTIPSLGPAADAEYDEGSGGGAAGGLSPALTSPTQGAWAAAVSLSSKLFGRGSRAGPPHS